MSQITYKKHKKKQNAVDLETYVITTIAGLNIT